MEHGLGHARGVSEAVKPKSVDHHRRWVLRLFEWGVIASIIALFYGLFLNHMGRTQAEIERQNFLTTVRELQAAVLLHSVIHPKEVTPGGNPATIYHRQFGMLPAGYVGAFDRPDPVTVTGGSWYFDSRPRQLVYRVGSERYFRSRLKGPPRVRLIVARKADSNRLTVTILDDGDWTVGGKIRRN